MILPSPSLAPARHLSRLPGAARTAASAALICAVAGASVRFAFPAAEAVWQAMLGLAVLAPLAVALAAGLSSGRETLAWTSIACGLVVTGIAGEHGMPGGHGIPPAEIGTGDVLWLLRYPLLYGALALLVAARITNFGVRAVLDGLVGAFAAAGLFQLVAGPWLVDGAQLDGAVVDLRATYPLLDVLVIGFLAGAAVVNGWPKVVWLPLAADLTLFLAGGVVDLRAALRAPGDPLGWGSFPLFLASAWCLAFAIFALQRTARRVIVPVRPAGPAIVLGAGAVATLVAGSWTHAPLAAILAGASLLAALARQWLTVRDNERLLAVSRDEALTDALTGLGNRRALNDDLLVAAREATADRPLTLALYDLDGFKYYNDTFGHPAGDALLQRLGETLGATVRPGGRAYRMGGDEFCIVADGVADHAALVAAGRRALTDHGEGFRIGASAGVAWLPGDARDTTDLLRLADHRMYAEKGAGRRGGDAVSATAALLQIVRERDPLLGEHTHDVGTWAAGVAAALGAGPDLVEQARLGGELHDVGKTAIPDAILHKPGPLDDAEWTFMRRHTVIGERILLADPALAPIAHVARSHHERWDGGGYPDGTAGEDIPFLARIICVCDAYEAMVADRAYRRGRPHEEAIGELIRCRGAQFDPAMVDAFVEVVAPTLSVRAVR